MQVAIHTAFKSQPETLLLPVDKSQCETILQSIAARTQINISILQNDFDAAYKSSHTIYFSDNNSTSRLILLGLGEAPDFKKISAAFQSFIFKNQSKLGKSCALDLISTSGAETWAEAIVNGVTLGTNNVNLFKSEPQAPSDFASETGVLDIYISARNSDNLKRLIHKGYQSALTQMEMIRLVNLPANKKAPEVLANWAVNSGKQNGFNVTVFDKEKCEEIGLHGLLAVNRGSEDPARFIIMEYKGTGAKQKVGLVGKGVTFDTGGVSLKPSTNMMQMKSDMGGAAAVLGTMELVAKLKLPIHLIAIVPSTDNSVGTNAIKPSDVISSYSGKTIEIIDTDAEGRLILADGLAYMEKHFQPDVMIDLATLTGHVVKVLGGHAAGLFTKNVVLASQLLAAGQATSERLWQLPMWDEYKAYIQSDLADVKNYSGKPFAGSTTAAKFLEHFTNEHKNWAHIDIAGVATAANEFGKQKMPTAYGVRLLTQFIEELAK